MPTPAIKSLAKKAGKSIDKAEELWSKAKTIAKEAGHDENYAYITGIFKKSLGLSESEFKEYIEENKTIFKEMEYKETMKEFEENKSIERYQPVNRQSLNEELSKKLYIGTYGSRRIYLEINIKSKEKAIDWVTLEPVENRDVVAISGNIGNMQYGQIDDSLMEYYNSGELKLSMSEADFLTLMKIWDKYHLNDLIPGTKEQMLKIKELKSQGFDVSANNYTNLIQVIPKGINSYTYGTRWLSREVPKYIIDFLTKL